MARPASLDASAWLPTYGWWPPPERYDVTVVLSTYHVAVDPAAEFHFALRGYHGSPHPAWEYEVGRRRHGDETAVRLRDLDLPKPPPHGGVLEVHGVRLDRQPARGSGFLGMWIDAREPPGGGYVIPTIPIRAQAKSIARDDVQVVPGILGAADVETELVLLNVVVEPTTVQLVASSASGLEVRGEPFEIEPMTARELELSRHLPGLRRLLADDGGVGSLAIRSSHRLLPYFGFRRPGGPVLSMDHAAPIFA